MEFIPRYSVLIGRVGTAVYLLLKHKGPGGRLLAPANLCYAALYPALYAGWSVSFCDVDPATGNLTLSLLEQALDAHRPDAVILPHMYGQPIERLDDMVALCRGRGTLTIEDCASALGASSPEYPVGKTGDYTLCSTGYAKIVEVGYGGILASETDPLDWVPALEEELPFYGPAVERTETLFSRLYRVLRNEGEGVLEKAVYRALPQGARNMFLFRLTDRQKETMEKALEELPGEVSRRRACLAECEKTLREQGALKPAGPLQLYPYTPGAVPWRLSFFVPVALRGRLVQVCLEEGLPVSDWYPRVTPMFGDAGEYPGARAMEERILNLPLRPDTARDLCPALARLAKKCSEDKEVSDS